MSNFYEGPTGRKRLLRTYENTRQDCFDDLLYCCAVTVEDALLLGGAIPGVDYTRIKLFELAMPLALSRLTMHTSITVGIPDTHPHAGIRPSRKTNHTATKKDHP